MTELSIEELLELHIKYKTEADHIKMKLDQVRNALKEKMVLMETPFFSATHDGRTYNISYKEVEQKRLNTDSAKAYIEDTGQDLEKFMKKSKYMKLLVKRKES